jgi:hypothetical protein
MTIVNQMAGINLSRLSKGLSEIERFEGHSRSIASGSIGLSLLRCRRIWKFSVGLSTRLFMPSWNKHALQSSPWRSPSHYIIEFWVSKDTPRRFQDVNLAWPACSVQSLVGHAHGNQRCTIWTNWIIQQFWTAHLIGMVECIQPKPSLKLCTRWHCRRFDKNEPTLSQFAAAVQA